MEKLIAMFMDAFTALLALFGYKLPELDAETKDNLETMFDNLVNYKPQA